MKEEGMSKGKMWLRLAFLLINLIFVSSLTIANQVPVLDPIGPKSVYEFHTLIFGIHATDSDGDPIVLKANNLPTNSTFFDSGNGGGYFRFTPNYTQAGVYNVTFIARDTAGASDSEVVQITVIDIDYTTIFVSDTITYQGHIKTKVPVYIDNINQNIEGFELTFTIGTPDRAYFTTDHFEVFIDTVCSDSVTPCPPEKIIRIDTTISRIVKIDTLGSVASIYEILQARGETGDTNSSFCVNMSVLGLAWHNPPISPGFGLLFNLYLDVLCLPDSLLPDTLVFVNVNGTLAQGDSIIKAKMFLPGRLIILGGNKYGDANGDANVSIADVVYIISYLFKGGPPPDPWIEGDANGDGNISIADAVYLINYLFKGGPPPRCTEEI